jgi:hypothetical protein
LYLIDQGEVHLTGTWWYENGPVGNEIPPRVQIEGRKTDDGRFWPDVTLQVKNKLTGKWKTLVKRSGQGKPTTVIIEPNGRNFDLTVNLDVFKPLADTHALGRIILKNGQSSEFELKYLLPPEKDA